MKIAFLNKYQTKVNRGAERYVAELAKYLSENHSVDVISNINYLEILKKKYDVVIPTNGREQVFIARIITWLTGTRMIVAGQSGIGLDDRLNLYSFPDYFVGLSDYATNWAKKINPFVKIIKIPNGVDVGEFANCKDKIDFDLPHPIILSVGALVESKRHDLVIKAVSKLKKGSLLIVGKGDQKDTLIKLCEDLIPGRYQFAEFSFFEMPKVYKSVDLFTFVTVPWESFGIVMVEAMASGLPVVVSDDPIRREIVGRNGLFVDPTNTDEYAQKIEEALNFKSKTDKKWLEQYDWKNIALKYQDLFKKL